jgi:hypothetical protein
MDAYISPRSTAFARYSQASWVYFLAPNIPGLAGGNSNGTLYAYTRQIAAGYNFTPSPNSILQLRLGLTWTTSGKAPVNIGATNLLAEYNIPNIPTNPTIIGGLNSQAVTGYSQFGRQTTNPQFTNPYDANPKVNYSVLKGRNSFKMGGEYGYFNMAISDFHPQCSVMAAGNLGRLGGYGPQFGHQRLAHQPYLHSLSSVRGVEYQRGLLGPPQPGQHGEDSVCA